MRGLLVDVNVQGHLPYLRQLLESLGLGSVLAEIPLNLVTFPDLPFPRDLDDRSLWNRCQRDGWVLFTDNRSAVANASGSDGLCPRRRTDLQFEIEHRTQEISDDAGENGQ